MSKGGYRPGSGRKKGSIPWNVGKPMSESSKEKLSLSQKGKKAWNKGIPMSEETKHKLSLIRKGKPSPWKGRHPTEQTLQKMRLARLGKPSGRKGMKLSKEWIEKIAASKRGKTHSPELREKNRQGQYNRYLKINPDYKVTTRNKRIAENGGFHSEKEWKNLKAQYNFTCPCCGKSEPEIKLTRDHILPIIIKGRNDITNIQPLCLQCNKRKYTQIVRY